jgi:Protein kinase domain
MSGSSADNLDELADALTIFLAWKDADRTRSTADLIAKHPGQAELLAFLIDEDTREREQCRDDDDPSPRVRTLGDFSIIREIGRGGMGVVFEAEQLSLRRRVALKVLQPHLTMNPASAVWLQNEARLVGSLNCPGIVQVFACSHEGDEHYIAMELIDGRSLDAILAEHGGRMELGQAVALIAQIADALHHAHQHNIVHRDVKPSNILVRPDGRPVLTDFGIARDQGLPSLTLTGNFLGTPYYVSPEQVSAKRFKVDHRTDVYSLGATLYEMLTGEHVFEGDNSAEVIGNLLNQEIRDPSRVNPNIPRDVSAILCRALEKSPDRRYLTAEDFATDLRRYQDGRPVVARPITRAKRTWRWARREPRVAVSLAMVLVTLTVGLSISTFFYKEADAALQDYTRLADGVLLGRLVREARDDLVPAIPERSIAMQDWIDRVVKLTDRLRGETRGVARAGTAVFGPGSCARPCDPSAGASCRGVEARCGPLPRSRERLGGDDLPGAAATRGAVGPPGRGRTPARRVAHAGASHLAVRRSQAAVPARHTGDPRRGTRAVRHARKWAARRGA